MTYLPEPGEPHSLNCRWCGGARTTRFERVSVGGLEDGGLTCVHACMRCDTDQRGSGNGPPAFMTEWAQRARETRE